MDGGRGGMFLSAAPAPAPPAPTAPEARAVPSWKQGGPQNSPVRSRVPFPPPDRRGGPGMLAAAHLGLRCWRPPSSSPSLPPEDGAVFYGEVKGYRVTAGLPCAPVSQRGALHAAFVADSRRAGLKTIHFAVTVDPPDEATGADADRAADVHARDRARSCWHIGDLPVFGLARWREETTIPAPIRAQVRRARRRDVTVRHWAAPPGDLALDALRAVRDEWLRLKPLPPLSFMTTPYLFEPWPAEGVFVAEARGRIVGFLVGSRVLFGDMLRIDVVARLSASPNGTAEMLVYEAFRAAARRGRAHATLGLAPLSRRSGIKSGGWRGVVAGCARRWADPFYSCAGLEAFKAKFSPDAWVPLYAVAPGRAFGPRDLLAIARVFTGGSLSRFLVRAVREACTRRSR